MNRHGNAYIEYFVLALIVALATILFYRKPNGEESRFDSVVGSVSEAFDDAVDRILAP